MPVIPIFFLQNWCENFLNLAKFGVNFCNKNPNIFLATEGRPTPNEVNLASIGKKGQLPGGRKPEHLGGGQLWGWTALG